MTIEAIGINYDNIDNSILTIESSKHTTYTDEAGERRTQYSGDFLHLITFSDYAEIACSLDTWSGNRRFKIKVTIDITKSFEDMITITSKNKTLINTVYKAILNNEDCWAEDILNKHPEILV